LKSDFEPTAEQITAELLNVAEWFALHGRNTNTAVVGICTTAATLIESLQARLSESQRRERAAVEDITTMAKCKLLGTCTFCKHRNTPDMRYKPCKGCIQENRSRKNFEWRGPQEAGKGEA